MARRINRLTARTVETVSRSGRHADGDGLYLSIDKNGGKRWVFLFRDRRTGKLREMGLGSLRSVSLADARKAAADARAVLLSGEDPISKRKSRSGNVPTFGEISIDYICAMRSAWRNEKHRAQWEMTLRVYCAPLAELPVSRITTDDVLQVLRPIWCRIPESASRIRGRIETILDAAKAKGHREGENPARWRGHLDHLLPPRQRLTRGHHAAMAFEGVPTFIRHLRRRPSVAALALEFLILTAARTSEVLGMRWEELDLRMGLWIVPAARMKAGREHRVPLSPRALEILEAARHLSGAPYVFPGPGGMRPLSQMAFLALLRRMGIPGVTPHGFRSSFRDWCGESTPFPREVAEAALAHTTRDRVEAAYRRGDALQKRRELMEAWAHFLSATAIGGAPTSAPTEECAIP